MGCGHHKSQARSPQACQRCVLRHHAPLTEAMPLHKLLRQRGKFRVSIRQPATVFSDVAFQLGEPQSQLPQRSVVRGNISQYPARALNCYGPGFSVTLPSPFINATSLANAVTRVCCMPCRAALS